MAERGRRRAYKKPEGATIVKTFAATARQLHTARGRISVALTKKVRLVMTSGTEDALGQRIGLRDEKEPLAVNHQSFDWLPFPQRLAPCKVELEPASAATGPVIKSTVNADI